MNVPASKISYLSVIGFVLGTGANAWCQSPDLEFFEKKIRPVLTSRCASCHNEKHRMAGMDLGSTSGIAAVANASGFLVKGDPEQSRLVKVISYQDRLRMPPTGKLPDDIIADFKTWISAGASMPSSAPKTSIATKGWSAEKLQHWAFQPVKEQAPPAVKNTAWAKSPIDRFILSKLEQKGLAPAKPADKLTLLRRAKFDLHGLPPTEEEMQAFLGDTSNGAFEHLVDRLLASPRYGEKWARHWMDVARYAESTGLDENTAYPEAWRYREYLIDAFNRDLPYDRFVIEQIAGDLLPAEAGAEVNARGIVATGFLGLGPKAIVEVDKTKTVYDVVDEQIDTTSKAFLGLTVACARCHDHKFDPVSAKDYYSLAAIFANTKSYSSNDNRGSIVYQAPLVNRDVFERYRAHQAKIASKNVEISAILGDELWKLQAQRFFPRLPDYMVAAWMVANGKGTADEISKQRHLDGKVLNEWLKYLKPGGTFRLHLKRWREANESNVAEIAKEYDALFQGPAKQWGAILSEWRQVMEATNRGEKPARTKPLQVALGYTSNDPHFERFVTDPLQRFVSEIACPTDQNLDMSGIEDGPFVLPEPTSEHLLPASVQTRLAALRKEIDELRKSSPPKPPMANAVGDGPALGASPMVTQRVFIRGSYSNLGDAVERGFPEIIRLGHEQLPAQGSGRLELSRWITDPANPLTARVMVNRLWQAHFGDGLVRTPNNFGLTGELPTHPELLDYLAKRFVASGWSIKRMHREMMLTSLYQSSSQGTPQSWESDPSNRLWSRFKRRRIAIEEMRDSWLQFSNALELKTGSIFDQVGDGNTSGRGRGAGPIPFDTSKVRTVYLPVSRNGIATPMVLNDFVDSTTSAGDRPETVIAPQALYLMNNAFVTTQAEAIAKRLSADADASEEDRVRRAFRIIWNREPEPHDIQEATGFLRNYPAGAKGSPAAWAALCRALMSANQFHYID